MSVIFDISNKRILLVGATGVLGRVYASALAEQGAQLVLADTDQTDVISYAQELGVLAKTIDVTSEKSVIDL